MSAGSLRVLSVNTRLAGTMSSEQGILLEESAPSVLFSFYPLIRRSQTGGTDTVLVIRYDA